MKHVFSLPPPVFTNNTVIQSVSTFENMWIKLTQTSKHKTFFEKLMILNQKIFKGWKMKTFCNLCKLKAHPIRIHLFKSFSCNSYEINNEHFKDSVKARSLHFLRYVTKTESENYKFYVKGKH